MFLHILAMKVAEALERLIDMRVPGAIEAEALMPTDPNAALDIDAIAAPLLLSATHVGTSPVMDEAARLIDLNLTTAMQKKYALGAIFVLGQESWDDGHLSAKRLSAEAKRLFESTFTGFVFHKHRRLLYTSGILLAATLACLLLPPIIRLVASYYLESVAAIMGTDVTVAGEYIVAARVHKMTYGRLKSALGAVQSHAATTAPGAPELGPFTKERIQELASKDAGFFAQYDISTFRALADHVDEGVYDWMRDQNGSDSATRLLAQAVTFTLVVVEPIAEAISRMTLLILGCLVASLVVAVTRQADVYLFDDDTRDRRTFGRVANVVAFAGGAAAVVYAARNMHMQWFAAAATLAALISAKQFFAVWDHKPS
jgi:hypothetical protein